MKMVQSSDARLCGPSNWGDCLIPLPSVFLSLKACQTRTRRKKKEKERKKKKTQQRVWKDRRSRGGNESGDGKTAFRKKKGGSLRPLPEEMRRQAEEEGRGVNVWRKQQCECVWVCVSAIAHQPVKHPLQTANPHSHCAAEVYHLTGAPSSPSHIVLWYNIYVFASVCVCKGVRV